MAKSQRDGCQSPLHKDGVSADLSQTTKWVLLVFRFRVCRSLLCPFSRYGFVYCFGGVAKADFLPLFLTVRSVSDYFLFTKGRWSVRTAENREKVVVFVPGS
eukprot:m.64151 g.64151  ORF g.64151 m.64151 type:complete len:102 (+) comp35225_c0_seq2:98-403(+)